MNDHEKSVLLVKAAGWFIEHQESEDIQTGKVYWTSWISDENGTPIKWPCGESTIEWISPFFKPGWNAFKLDLYDLANMGLAWKILNWAWKKHDRMVIFVDEPDVPLAFWTWRIMNTLWQAGNKEPEEALRDILDRIFSLSIEAGLIEVQDD